MIDQHENQTDATDEDQAVRDGVRQFQLLLDHPFAAGFLAVAGAAILFWLSFFIGETVYRAFAEDDRAAMFGFTVATGLVVIAAVVAWFGRHRQTRDDERALTAIREFHPVLDQPFAVGFLAVAGVLVLFWLGIGVGETLYGAFDGNTGGAAVFAVILVTAIVAIVAIGAWLDRRRPAHDDEGPRTDQRS